MWLWCGHVDWTSNFDTLKKRKWLPNVSEEAGGYSWCPWNSFITGMSATGPYSDNISLECAEHYPQGAYGWQACYWTDKVSEEKPGYLDFSRYGLKYSPVAMQCTGAYCDNKRFLVCRQ